MSDKLRTSQPELSLPIPKASRPKLLIKYLGYLLAATVTLIVIYQLFFMVQITAGVSNEKPAPEQTATVEIINASGNAQNSKLVTEKLETGKQDRIEIIVITAERLEYKNLTKSLVISRDEDTELAEFVAKSLGLNESEVVFRRAYENDMSPAVTLVLGEDIQELLNPKKPNKES